MSFLDNMNRALDYIEDHLTEDIEYRKLAEKALCSVSNFQRFFTYVSFSRAFQSMHGVSPTDARQGKTVRAYPRLTFCFSIKGDMAMNYRILEKPAFRMIGIKERICRRKNHDPEYMPEFWRSHMAERLLLSALSSETPGSVYGVTMNYTDESFDYCLAAISDQPAESSMIELLIPESKWAVFQCIGPLPDAQYDMWRRIFLEWLPLSGLSLADLPEIEWYSAGDISASDYGSTIWLPLQI